MKNSVNKSEVMKAAWEMFKASSKRTMAFFSICLKDAWKMAKTALKARPSIDLQDVKWTLLQLGNTIGQGSHGVAGEARSIVYYVATELNGFATDVAQTVLKYKRISEKQAYVIARAYVENY